MDPLVSAYLIEMSGKLLQRMQRKTQGFKGRQTTEKIFESVKKNRAKVHVHPTKRQKKM